METKIKEKTFDTVRFFRSEKERIARETEDMSFEELKEFITKKNKWLEKE